MLRPQMLGDHAEITEDEVVGNLRMASALGNIPRQRLKNESPHSWPGIVLAFILPKTVKEVLK